MANQFDSEIRFIPIEWEAFDKKTNTRADVFDCGDCARWSVKQLQTGRVVTGECTTPKAARAACRRFIAQLPRHDRQK